MSYLHHSKTKIVATLGPASNTPKMIRALIQSGVNVFRLNFSHGTKADHEKTARTIREAAQKTGQTIGILADLQGPKLRIGTFKDGSVTIKRGQTFRFDLDKTPGDKTRVCLPHPEILSLLKKDSTLFLDDGNVRVTVTKKGETYIDTKIENGDSLSDRKGLNVPGVILPIPALTVKDKKDLKTALSLDVDWIAQSFVQTPADVKQAQALIKGKAKLMVKLEKPGAIEHLEEIMDLADGVMIARGDLGVEIAPERVPAVQKQIIRMARAKGKPVVVATQMLESMVDHARPTRAEASDVATAVYEGTDAVMLSAETAVGKHPVRAVEMMTRICRSTENEDIYHDVMGLKHPETDDDNVSDSIATATYHVAQDINAKAIVTYTTSGSTALRIARQRPRMPILCLTPNEKTARQLCVSYGVYAVHSPDLKGKFDQPLAKASRILQSEKIAKKGDRFVMTAGVPFGVSGTTNALRVAKVE